MDRHDAARERGTGAQKSYTDESYYDGPNALYQMPWSSAYADDVEARTNPYRYAGAYQDTTGLYHMGERYYDPAVGRFTQQDPVQNPLDPKLWNRYAYVGDDPVNFLDPSGLHWYSGAWGWLKCAARKFLPVDPLAFGVYGDLFSGKYEAETNFGLHLGSPLWHPVGELVKATAVWVVDAITGKKWGAWSLRRKLCGSADAAPGVWRNASRD